MEIPAQRFGKTRSGKSICTYTTDDSKDVVGLVGNFSPADYFDAMALFQYLTIRELRRRGNGTDDFRRFIWYDRLHSQLLGHARQDLERRILSLVTSIAVVRHGQSRADQIFVD